MKSAGISDLKATLKRQSPAQLVELCLRLARFKKDNKELLSFLLYDADDLTLYLNTLKKELDDEVAAINTGNLFWVKKSLRKIIRLQNKHIRYTGSKIADLELRIHLCTLLKKSAIPIKRSTALVNLYNSQLKKIDVALKAVHDDLQRDYQLQVDDLKL